MKGLSLSREKGKERKGKKRKKRDEWMDGREIFQSCAILERMNHSVC